MPLRVVECVATVMSGCRERQAITAARLGTTSFVFSNDEKRGAEKKKIGVLKTHIFLRLLLRTTYYFIATTDYEMQQQPTTTTLPTPGENQEKNP